MDKHDIIVIGASAGGVEALTQIASGLPADFPAAVFVVLHVPAQAPSALPRILSRSGPLPAAHAQDGTSIETGRIYIAPPDRHMMLERQRIRVVRGPRENRTRPAIDPLFRSAARAYGPRAIGVVLTGTLDDGTAGLYAIKQRGGVAVAQDPRDAYYPDMPASAIQYVAVDHVLPLAEIPALLMKLAKTPVPDELAYPVPWTMDRELAGDKMGAAIVEPSEVPGNLSSFTCPECGGPIYELRDGALVRFRCRSGHAFTGEHMLAQQSEEIEEALWSALNTLNESAQMARRLGDEAKQRGHMHVAQRLDEREQTAHKQAESIRKLLIGGIPPQSEDVSSNGKL